MNYEFISQKFVISIDKILLQAKELPGNILKKGYMICDRGTYLLDPLQTSRVTLLPKFLPPNLAEKLFDIFTESLKFENIHSTRSVLWFGPTSYKYGRTNLEQRPLDSENEVHGLSKKLEAYLGTKFNSCLVNLYKDNKSMIPKHSDDEYLFGVDPVIASLSLGETRRFVLKPNGKSSMKAIKSRYIFVLQAGDLLLMTGETQQYWLHSVPEEPFICKPRINLTFRNVTKF